MMMIVYTWQSQCGYRALAFMSDCNNNGKLCSNKNSFTSCGALRQIFVLAIGLFTFTMV